MPHDFIKNYLESIVKQFEYYKQLGEKTFTQLDDASLFWTDNEESNSISVIVQHLHGNMLSRWTDFLNSDGEKDFRKRDQEFEKIITTRQEMITLWEEGWTCLFKALQSVSVENFHQLVYIRNIGHTITEAINRQLAHYAYHIGQIVFIGKVRAKQWDTLSIAKGKSKDYNDKKFSKPKSRGHFTDDFLDRPPKV